MGRSAQFWPWRGDAPATTMGRVYFYDPTAKKHYYCSGTVVESYGRNLVWTAGHCVHHGKGGSWHQNWVFYPHYYNGVDWNYGIWYAGQLASWSKWMNNSDFRYDYGAAMLYTNGYGQNIMDVTGGQGLAWNYSKYQHLYAFGYPAEPPFNGSKLMYCQGGTWASGSDIGMNCNMNGGASGGGWLMGFDGWTGWVNGAASYKIVGQNGQLYSPYFGNAVGTLYNLVK